MTVFTPLQTDWKAQKKSIYLMFMKEVIYLTVKKYALSFIIQDHSKTLTDAQIDKIGKLQKNFETELAF
jgi:hypothetical protein